MFLLIGRITKVFVAQIGERKGYPYYFLSMNIIDFLGNKLTLDN